MYHDHILKLSDEAKSENLTNWATRFICLYEFFVLPEPVTHRPSRINRLADELGVGRKTLRNWLYFGTYPSAGSVEKINGLYAKLYPLYCFTFMRMQVKEGED